VHLDAAAGLPLHPAARAALLACLDDGWADPSRLHAPGRRARLLLDGARAAVAGVLGARPDEVSFTPSGTVAAHLGVLGAAAGRRRTGRHVVHSAVEHSCVLHAVEHLVERDGAEASEVGVDRLGRVDDGAFAAALRDDTALACLISASHEVGTVQPVEAVAAACAARGVPLLVDASQTVGRSPVPTGWSVLTASAHKWGGPSGVGVLAVRTGTRFRSALPADEREAGRVPGRRPCRWWWRPPPGCRRRRPRLPTRTPGCARWSTGCATASPRPCRTSRWWATRARAPTGGSPTC
jgi:cysteine desulfurase